MASLTITTNKAALGVTRNLAINERMASNHARNMASGTRITSAATDSAAQSIGLRLESLINNMTQASRNARQAASLVQAAAGGAETIAKTIDRMQILSAISSSDAVDDDARTLANEEFLKLRAQVSTIAEQTRFNGVSLLSVAANTFQFRINTDTTDTLAITMPQVDAATLSINANAISTRALADTASTALDTAGKDVRTAIAQLGAFQAQLASALDNLQIGIENAQGAKSSFVDANMAEEMVAKTRHEMLLQTGFSSLSSSMSNLSYISNFIQQN